MYRYRIKLKINVPFDKRSVPVRFGAFLFYFPQTSNHSVTSAAYL